MRAVLDNFFLFVTDKKELEKYMRHFYIMKTVLELYKTFSSVISIQTFMYINTKNKKINLIPTAELLISYFINNDSYSII